MNCVVCHRSIGSRSKKCSICGAPTSLGKGDFLFEMNSADERQLKKYYEQWLAQKTELDGSNREKNKSVAITTVNTFTSVQVSGNAHHAKHYVLSDFFHKHGLTLLKYVSLSSPLIFFISNIWTPALIFYLTALLLSLYLICTQLCYTNFRTKVFWICTILCAIGWVAAFILGKTSTEAAKAMVQNCIEISEKYSIDVEGQLNIEWNRMRTVNAMEGMFFLFPYSNLLVRYEEKKTKTRLIWVIVGIVFSFVLALWAAYDFGYLVAFKKEIARHLTANAIEITEFVKLL